MRLLQSTLDQTLQQVPADAFEQLAELIDNEWIEQALARSGKASIRRRKPPAEHAVWLVIGLSLYRQLPMWQVVQQLSLSLDGAELPAPSASVRARQRLGCEPLEELFGLLTRAAPGAAVPLALGDRAGVPRHQAITARRSGGAAQQAARVGQAGGLGPVDCVHAAAPLDAQDGRRRRRGAHAHQLPHRAARHCRVAAPGQLVNARHLASATGASAGAGPILPASTKTARPVLPSPGQEPSSQVPDEKNASQA